MKASSASCFLKMCSSIKLCLIFCTEVLLIGYLVPAPVFLCLWLLVIVITKQKNKWLFFRKRKIGGSSPLVYRHPLNWCFCTAHSRTFFSFCLWRSILLFNSKCLLRQVTLLEGYICKSFTVRVCIFIQKAYKGIGTVLEDLSPL